MKRQESEKTIVNAPSFPYTVNGSWEHLIFMVKHGIRESLACNLAPLWGYGEELSRKVVVAHKKMCFFPGYDALFFATTGIPQKERARTMEEHIAVIVQRGRAEMAFWEKEKRIICGYSREQAIAELIRSKKINEKIQQIKQYVEGILNA